MSESGKRFVKPFVITSLALIAFVANSVLCRLALGGRAIDAAGFTFIRLLSGAIVLLCILKIGVCSSWVAMRIPQKALPDKITAPSFRDGYSYITILENNADN